MKLLTYALAFLLAVWWNTTLFGHSVAAAIQTYIAQHIV